MKEIYALVHTTSGFTVTLYADWMEYPIGCVMQTSDDVRELLDEAVWRNNTYKEFVEE
jgi:hypothetical protein